MIDASYVLVVRAESPFSKLGEPKPGLQFSDEPGFLRHLQYGWVADKQLVHDILVQ